MNAPTFRAVVADGGRGRIRIPLPFDPDERWGAKAAHHVSGTVGAVRVRGTIDVTADGAALLLGPSVHREIGGSLVGREVVVTLAPEGPQRADLAPDLAAALAANPAAGEFFDALAQFYRRGYLTWIDATKKSPEKRAERIAEVVRLLAAGVKQRP